MTHHRRNAAASATLLLALLMTGCGGGGGGGSSPGTATPAIGTTPPIVVSPPDPPPPPASAPSSTVACAPGDAPSMRSTSFTLVNVIRTAVGLPNFVRLPALDGTAQDHAQYVAANGGSGSDESPGLACFTGADLAQRLSAAGVVVVDTPGARARSESVLAYLAPPGSEPDAWGIVNDMLNNLYGRVILLDPHAQQMGIGFSVAQAGQQHAMVLDTAITAGTAGAGDEAWVVWPRDGATGLPGQMRASNLKPLGDAFTEGYPVSLHASAAVQVSRFVITNAAGGAPVAATLLTAANDRNAVLGAGEAALVPQAPLAAGTTYHVELDGMAGMQPLHLAWSFTTAS